MSPKTKGILSIIASAFGFAVMALCVRLCDDCGSPISSFEKSFFRNVVAFAIALVVFVREGEKLKGRGHGQRRTFNFNFNFNSLSLLLLRATLGTLGIFANFYALSHIDIADGQTLNKTAPFFTVLLAWLFLGERLRRRQFVSLVLAFVGVLFVTKPGFAGDETLPLLAGLFGGACAGGAYACLRGLRQRGVPSTFIVLFFSAFSCVASVPFMLLRFDPLTFSQVLVLLGAGAGAALGQFGITLAYGYAAPREIAVFDYTNILFTALLGFVFFGQLPDAWSLAGFAAIVIAASELHFVTTFRRKHTGADTHKIANTPANKHHSSN